MKIFKFLLLLLIVAIFFFFMFLGYDKYYWIYWKSEVNKDEIESYTYLIENFSLSINHANINQDSNGYFIDFEVTVQNKSPEFLNSITLIPKIEIVTGIDSSNGGYQTVGIAPTEVLYTQVLDAGKAITVSKKLYFTDNDSYDGFNTDLLRYKVQKATFSLQLDGKNSTGYEISDKANTNYYIVKFDITSEWEGIQNR